MQPKDINSAIITNGSSSGLNIAIFTGGGSNDLAMYDELATSTFNTVVLWSMGVDILGNIHIRNFGQQEILVKDGVYNPQNNPGIEQFREKVLELKEQGSNITRIELSFGVGSYYAHGDLIIDSTFTNIKNIYQSQINNPSITSFNLISNIQTLQRELYLDAVSFDDEVEYDQASSLWLAQQCGLLGMKVSICPYTNQSYWSGLVSAANQNGTLIDIVYLQAWTGGPQGWVLDGINPTAGIYIDQDSQAPVTPAQAAQQFAAWAQQQTLAGGWYYNAGDIYANNIGSFTDYANAVQSA